MTLSHYRRALREAFGVEDVNERANLHDSGLRTQARSERDVLPAL